ncbi:hypothetical protein N8603_00375 [Verrucomicrobiales bacterium]|nr:hypothetical protein [Verrucomicrobiales bacterium]
MFQIFCLCLTIIFADAATTSVTVGGQDYTVTYESTSYDGNASQFQSTPWWNDSSLAQSFAQATSVRNVHYAYQTWSSFVDYQKSNSSGGSVAGTWSTSSTFKYAVSAVAVPAPLPILGILPVVGFLKRMRKRQRA